VDDEFLIRWMLSEELRDVGYQVIEACDAGEALEILKGLDPDLIISDVRMPGPIDGMGLLALVRETQPTLPVMIISGHLNPRQALIEGATHFIAKPYRLEEVIGTVQNLLEDNR
jgi:two-component system C4-dicarboxylate transport response regulator DctD